MSELQQLSSEWESIVAEIEEKLLTLKAPELNDVYAALGITVDEHYKGLPRKLRRLILQYIGELSQERMKECLFCWD